MPLRKQMTTKKRVSGQEDGEETQEDDACSDMDEVQCPAASREMRRRERQHKLMAKGAEMTEEEMMDLALRLSEQEANMKAQRLQEEEDAVRRAIQDSMLGESQSLMDDAPLCVTTRRKLVYSNGESQTDTADRSTQEDRSQRTRKRRRADGSPLMEMPQLSQTQPSPSSPESATPGSPQSCDSTQIEDCDQLPKSPVFPSSSSAQMQVKALVHVARLDQIHLKSCATSGFVLCSQDGSLPTQNSDFPYRKCSPTFLKSPALRSKSPTSKSGNTQTDILDLGDDTQPTTSPVPCKSPVFGQTDLKSALELQPGEAVALVFSSQESSGDLSLEKDVSLIKSPVFLKTQHGLDMVEEGGSKSPVFGRSKPTENETLEDANAERHNTLDLSEREPTCDMTLHWSDEDDATPAVSPSPVFPQESGQNPHQTVEENKGSAPAQNHCRPECTAVSEAPCSSSDSTTQSTVHYYWGVPFCPRGLDPNQYTKVIVAQMEVYEKSLKQAQRGLFKKLEWGDPVLPQPEKSPSPEPSSPQIHLPSRRSRRRKGKLQEPHSEEEVEVEEETQRSQRDEEDEGHKSAAEEADKETGKGIEDEEPNEEQGALENLKNDEVQVESDCEICPETQLSDNDETQELTLALQAPPLSPEIETVQVDSPNVAECEQAEHEEPMEMEPELQEVSEPNEFPEVLQVKSAHVTSGRLSRESQLQEDPHREAPHPDTDPAPHLAPAIEAPVQCPICQRAFPSKQIEMHAAFCNGEPADVDRVSPKLRSKRTRHGEGDKTDHTDSGGAQEKCYKCLRYVPLREFVRHTERCLQLCRGPRAAASGGLLSALDQSEYKDSEAGPSGSSVQPQEVINLIDDEEDSMSLIPVSNSPIRSFTSISDAQDCLIDFRTQHSGKRPRPRPGSKAGTKRR